MSNAPPHDSQDTLDALDVLAPGPKLLGALPNGTDSLQAGLTLLAPEVPRAEAAGGEPSWLPVIERRSYEVAGEVGRGGIGRVLRACDMRLNRPVAIKELLGSAGDVAEERFIREALLTARLQHPSIVPLYEAGRWPSGAPFYAMKLVTGRSLEDVIAESRTLEQRLALLPHVLAATEAMAYAHSEQIIHRDLKPANVLVGAFGETVVIDWGLAKDLALPEVETPPQEEPAVMVAPVTPRPSRRTGPGTTPPAEALTLHGTVMGTPAYMPREQARGSNVDERADVYALGAILYHLLAGACPYEGETSVEILRQVQAGPPEPLATRQPGIPEDLLTIVNKAMARSRAGRYPSARELAEDLRRFQTGQIVGAHRYSRGELLRRFGRRYRAALSVGAAAILVLAITGAVSVRRIMVESSRAREKQAIAEAAEHRAVERADDLTLVQARAAVQRNPNQTIAWLKSLSPSFQRWPAARLIAADARAQGIATVLRGHTGVINGMSFSPDGKLLVTASDDHSVRLWDPAAPASSRVFAGHTDEVWAATFSPDGSLLVTGSKDRSIRIWDMKTGESRALVGHPAPITELAFAGPDRIASSSDDGTARLWDVKTGLRGHEGTVISAAFSPDGKTVASGSGDHTLRIWDLATGENRRVDAGGGGISQIVFSADGRTLFTCDSFDASVRLWDVATLTNRTRLRGHQGIVVRLSLSPDERRLVSASTDSTLRLWDLASGESRILRGHTNQVSDVAFSADGTQIVSSSWDGTVRVWPDDLPDDPGALRAWIEAATSAR